MRIMLLITVLGIGLVGCAADKYDVLHGERIHERVIVNNISQDTLTLEFRQPTGELIRRLVCDKWDSTCFEGRP